MTEQLKQHELCCGTVCDKRLLQAEYRQIEAQLEGLNGEETKMRAMLRMFVESIEAGNDDGIISAYRDAKEYLG